jgi:hypothetical protein
LKEAAHFWLLEDLFNDWGKINQWSFLNQDIAPYLLAKSVVFTMNKSEEGTILSCKVW